MKRLSLFLLSSLLGWSAIADWDSAIDLFGDGEFEQAYETFLSLRQPGRFSAPLEYNLGNTALRLGRADLAVAHYRRALWLNPSDGDLRANYSAALDITGAEESPLPLTRRVSDVLPMRIWRTGWFASVWIMAGFGLLRIKYERVRAATPWVAPMLVFILLLFGWGVWASSPAPLRHEAVILGGEVTARFEPHQTATEHFALPGGSVVQVEERTRGWIRVSSGQRSGWVPAEQLEFLDPVRRRE